MADAVSRLRAAGSDTPRLDAEVLLAHVTNRDRAWLFAHPEAEVVETDAFQALIKRRAAGEPVAYLRGFKEWHSLRIRTDVRALIPRPETELLADAAGDEIARRLARGAGSVRVVAWEVGTGSGAVAIVLAQSFAEALADGRLALLATDLSPEALELAAENFALHGVAEVRLQAADLLEGAGDGRPRPDVVVANLPYVSTAEVEARWGSLGYEPRVATDGGTDGLDLIRRLMGEVPGRAADGATILLEIGVGQVEAIRALAPEGASVEVVPDMAGLDRVVRIGLARS
ncbi:MAG TPA: HemK/PrmC family methyltransferase [Candidatus Limnocylindria bacterium]|nr:HemK/PrmC family methyltransferase [Candidatus Limnocylindria bacterium]